MSLMEQLEHSFDLSAIADMPQANDATHLWIVGHDIFLIMCTKDPQVIHIHSKQVAGLLYFMVEQLEGALGKT